MKNLLVLRQNGVLKSFTKINSKGKKCTECFRKGDYLQFIKLKL